jgi:putative transposase
MRNPLRRYYGRGDLHFITVSCYRRQPLLGSAGARNLFVKILGDVRTHCKVLLTGYVVMPEHVHLMVSESEKCDPSQFMQILKQESSSILRAADKMALGESRPPALWLKRFYDFNVWSEKKFWEKLEYMHLNPVKRGFVKHPRAWVWSSWGFYAKGEVGLISIDEVGEREDGGDEAVKDSGWRLETKSED